MTIDGAHAVLKHDVLHEGGEGHVPEPLPDVLFVTLGTSMHT